MVLKLTLGLEMLLKMEFDSGVGPTCYILLSLCKNQNDYSNNKCNQYGHTSTNYQAKIIIIVVIILICLILFFMLRYVFFVLNKVREFLQIFIFLNYFVVDHDADRRESFNDGLATNSHLNSITDNILLLKPFAFTITVARNETTKVIFVRVLEMISFANM